MKRKDFLLFLNLYSDSELLGRVLFIIYSEISIAYDELFTKTFEHSTGQQLAKELSRVLIQLKDDELITKTTKVTVIGHDPGYEYYTITGKGIKACKLARRFRANNYYSIGKRLVIAETIITSYLPVIISIIALIISIKKD
ncbi:MAG: hypothetical protein BGO70_10765 [Bacteroidetes bacterium 43-93]|nr:hypothetical protein [Bacteroidota bacterium]OJW95597.1 MAG: hypothetical protein BGO70_10765 [Bacteroidetes bacterium 43-93]